MNTVPVNSLAKFVHFKLYTVSTLCIGYTTYMRSQIMIKSCRDQILNILSNEVNVEPNALKHFASCLSVSKAHP